MEHADQDSKLQRKMFLVFRHGFCVCMLFEAQMWKSSVRERWGETEQESKTRSKMHGFGFKEKGY